MKFDICLNKKIYVVEIDGNNAKILSKAVLEEKDDDNDLDLPDFDFGEKDSEATQITATLPATVLAVYVQSGQAVSKGQTLLGLESMKMENAVTAPMDGIVGEVSVSVGSYVKKDQTILSVKKVVD